jgi:hypothetical protein
VRTLTIEAVSLASARGVHGALAGFHVELEQTGVTYAVAGQGCAATEIINVLRALEMHMMKRGTSTTV